MGDVSIFMGMAEQTAFKTGSKIVSNFHYNNLEKVIDI